MLHRHSPQVLEGVDDHESAAPEDRHPVGDALHLRQRVRREEDRASLRRHLPQQVVKPLLHQRIQSGDGLVEDQQLGLVHERLHEAELLAIAGRELPHGSVERGVEAVRQLVAHAPVDATMEICEEVEHLGAGELLKEREIAGEESDTPPDLEAPLARVDPEDRRRARGRTDQVDEETHGRRLPGAVRSEESEDLAALDLEVEPEESVPLAEVLAQRGRTDHGVGRHDPTLSPDPRRVPRRARRGVSPRRSSTMSDAPVPDTSGRSDDVSAPSSIG